MVISEGIFMKKKLDQQINTKKVGSEKIDESFTNYEIEIKA